MIPNEITLYFHCKECLLERPDNISPAEWARLSIGWTEHGFQVWCERHQNNVISIDFLGQKVAYRKFDKPEDSEITTAE